MKPLKIFCIALLITLITASVVSASENKEMPTEKEVTAFIYNFKASGDFANSAYDAFIEQYPTGHCDIWSNGMISLYYYDPDSPKEYGSIYLDNNGKEVKPGCGVNITCVKSYKGETKTEVKEEEKEETTEEDEEHTYKALRKALDDYDGKLSCSSKKCAKALSKYLENDENGGFDTEVVKKAWKNVNNGKKAYGVLVNTEDEGDVYIILG